MLVLKRCRKKMDVVLAINISVPFTARCWSVLLAFFPLTFGVGPPAFQRLFMWGHIDEVSRAV